MRYVFLAVTLTCIGISIGKIHSLSPYQNAAAHDAVSRTNQLGDTKEWGIKSKRTVTTRTIEHPFTLTTEDEVHNVPNHDHHQDMPDQTDGGHAHDKDKFCSGMMPMSMFMDGFRVTLNRPENDCLMYFVQSWTLKDADSFKGACVFSFLLAVFLEGLSAVRSTVQRNTSQPRWTRHGLLTAIYAVQALLGYLVMFLAMSYSIELVFSAVFGLAFGNLVFFRYESLAPQPRSHPAAPSRRDIRNARDHKSSVNCGISEGLHEPLLVNSFNSKRD
ncbi:predicted protein [Phaeodactylum tricornutum CCAP 1055/1]|jgi:hypothetical protein|uniref:Copper transport protein n=2 Tax=Phaeodactylum tricornutum TaxID=2850 RepID=B7G8E0_PHATC|nr:predicted protein [Phaeodactylum tricornutum CCAP 1055/1]EEC45030.1 predicted protein [Phaeodactylum tricornutum CCAP 1055/1]|eukprot:XP_002183330.1 predicted protein [Phaeodactylum tricornutum CCAP 1055/1]